jgi:O-antigen ligase
MKKIFNIEKSFSFIPFLLTIFLMPSYILRFNFYSIGTNLLDLMLLFSIFYWILFSDKSNILKKIIPHKGIVLGICLLLFGLSTSYLLNRPGILGLGIIKSWFILPMLFSLILLLEIKNLDDIKKIFFAIFLSSSLVSLSAILYKLYGYLTYDGRLTAFYESPNYLAMFLAPGILCGISLLFYSKKHFTYIFIALLLNSIVLFFSKSYANWISLLLTSLVSSFLFLNDNKKKIYALIFFLLIIGSLFLSQMNSEKAISLLTKDPRSSFESRKMIWKSSMLMIKNNPLIGIGPGNFQKTYLDYQKYFPLYLEWAVPQPHNILIAFWLQTGLLGLLGFMIIVYISIKNSLILLFKQKKDMRFYCISFVAFFMYTIISGLTDTPYWKNDLSLMFWIFIFLTASIKTLPEDSRL